MLLIIRLGAFFLFPPETRNTRKNKSFLWTKNFCPHLSRKNERKEYIEAEPGKPILSTGFPVFAYKNVGWAYMPTGQYRKVSVKIKRSEMGNCPVGIYPHPTMLGAGSICILGRKSVL